MRSKKLSLGMSMVFAAATIMTVTLAAAQTETVLFTFGPQESNIGAMPEGGVVRDAAGNLYGTTEYGGDISDEGFGFGKAFELSPRQAGVGPRRFCITSAVAARTDSIQNRASSWMPQATYTVRPTVAAPTTPEQSSSCRLRQVGAGPRRFCIASTTTGKMA
jgi:hypothetical protein